MNRGQILKNTIKTDSEKVPCGFSSIVCLFEKYMDSLTYAIETSEMKITRLSNYTMENRTKPTI